MLLCTKFPVTSNGGISEARGANRVDHRRLEGDSSVSQSLEQRCDPTLLVKEIREWRCGIEGSCARRNVRVPEKAELE